MAGKCDHDWRVNPHVNTDQQPADATAAVLVEQREVQLELTAGFVAQRAWGRRFLAEMVAAG